MNGLTLLAPAGLLALAALALPILIHLFNRSRGQRVLVGNIALYRQARRQRVTELRLVQWLLLLLRLGLLALAALLLAGLALPGNETLRGATAYLTPQWLADRTDREVLAGFDHVFLLAEHTPRLDARGEVPADRDDATPTEAGSDRWSLLAERLAQVHHVGDVHVFASERADEFPARAPALPGTLTWHLESPRTTNPAPSQALFVHLVVDEDRAQDAAVLTAALEAVASHRALSLQLTRQAMSDDEPGTIPLGQHGQASTRSVLVWLSSLQPPTVSGYDLLLADVATRGNVTREVQLPAEPTLAFMARPVSAPLTVDTQAAGVEVLWRADDGTPLLLRRFADGLERLVYLDRLGVDRDGPASRAAFPDVMARLLLGEPSWARGAASAPANPVAAVTRDRASAGKPFRSLAPWLVLAMALLFGFERWLAERPFRS